MSNEFIVISNSEDGDVSVERLTREEITERLTEGYYGPEVLPITKKELAVRCAVHSTGWDFANTGPRGLLIFPASAQVEPKKIKVVEKWEIE